MNAAAAPIVELDNAAIQRLLADYEMDVGNVAFCDHNGFRLLPADSEGARLEFTMAPQMVGNPKHQILHGGVIAGAIDMVGGVAGLIAAYRQLYPEERRSRLQRFGTIDIRVDYLQPGRGQLFLARGYVVRCGRKICSTRMDLRNEKEELIAVGSGSYMF